MKVGFFIKYWLPLLAWMAFIFIGSTDLLSAEHTSRVIGPFLRWFAPNVSDAMIASIQLVVRKCAHVTEYAILGALLYRAFCQSARLSFAPAASAFVISALYAALDEFHQSSVASRTASAWDVAIDCAGALLSITLLRFVANRKSRIEIRK